MTQPTVQLQMPLTHQLRTVGRTGQANYGPDKLLMPLAPSESINGGSSLTTGNSSSRPIAFADLLMEGVGAVNQAQHQADDQVHSLLTGGDVTQAEVLTSVQKADMAFRLLVQIRNKLMSAYEELNAIRV